MTVTILGGGVPSYSINKRATGFRCGRESLKDSAHPRRLDTVGAQETILEIHDIILSNR